MNRNTGKLEMTVLENASARVSVLNTHVGLSQNVQLAFTACIVPTFSFHVPRLQTSMKLL